MNILYRVVTMTLRQVRKRRGLTQKQLEGISGVTQAVISAIERGDTINPRLETARKLATALRVNVASLHFGPSESLSQGAA